MSVGRDPSKLRRIGEIAWTYYSAVSALFLVGVLVDLLYIWTVALPQGAVIYVNKYGEGLPEMVIFAVTIPWVVVMLGRSFPRVVPERGRRWRAAEDWKSEQARNMKALPVGTELILQHSNQITLEGKAVVIVSQRKRYIEVRLKDDLAGKTFFVPHADFWRIRTLPQTPAD